jgi:23S rRNA (guanosine2251-2'-O)-methyltransferase
VLTGITATPPHREIQKTALGATMTVKWSYFQSTLEAVLLFKEKGYAICSVEQAEKTTFLQDFKLDHRKIVLVFGNEVDGVEQAIINLSDEVIEIPQFGTKHSLNVSVTGGAVIWELTKQLITKVKG